MTCLGGRKILQKEEEEKTEDMDVEYGKGEIAPCGAAMPAC